jgi:sec-independent protein translocase protein TatB
LLKPFGRASFHRVFGVSFSEVVLIAIVALIVVGPRRLPEILGTLGKWVRKVRNVTTEMRRQTGIDEILRAEGLAGGLAELRSIVRGDFAGAHRYGGAQAPAYTAPGAVTDPYGEAVEFDRDRECPVEGPDAYGAIPEDLVQASRPEAPVAPSTPVVGQEPRER